MLISICPLFQLRLIVLLTAVVCGNACRLETVNPQDTTDSPGDVTSLSIGKNVTMLTFFQTVKYMVAETNSTIDWLINLSIDWLIQKLSARPIKDREMPLW